MRNAERSRRIARPQPLIEWLTAADFQAALNAARVDATPSVEAIQSAVTESREAVEAALRAIHIPDGSSLLLVVADLKAIAKANAKSRSRVIAALPSPIDQQDPRGSLTRRLRASDVTLIVALVDAASADAGTTNAAAALADALLDNDFARLGAWAEAAEAQYLAGAIRMPAAPTNAERQDLACRLGHTLMGTYATADRPESRGLTC